jgi:class 3 adenylate cyclase
MIGRMVMRDLPTGVVTLLFTDVEGSTRLLHSLGDDYGRRSRASTATPRSGLPEDLVTQALEPDAWLFP